MNARAWLRRFLRYLLSLPVLITALVLALYAVGGFFLAPYLVSREIPRFAAERLQAKAGVAEVRINPFLLTVELKGFELRERDDRPVFAFDRLFVDFEAASLLRWAWTIAEVSLAGPRVDLDIDPAGELNLVRLANRLTPAGPKAPAEEEPPPRLLLRHLDVARGRIAVTDRSDPTPAQALIEPVNFELKDISTLAGHAGNYTVNARLPAGGALAWQGKLTLQPIAAEGEIRVKDLKVATVWRFLQDELRVEEPAGSIDLELRYNARHERGAFQATASNLGVRTAGLDVKLRGADAPILTLAEAALSGGAFDFAQRSLSFGQLVLRRGTVSALRTESGALDWEGLVALKPAAAKAPPPAGDAKPAARPWRIVLDAVRLEEIAVRATDATRVQPLGVEVGRLDAGFVLSAEHGASVKAVVSDLALQLSRVRVTQRDAQAPLVTLDAATLEGGKIDAGARSITVPSIKLRGGETVATLEADGNLNLAQALAAKREEPPSDAPFAVTVESIELADHRIAATDRSHTPPLRYDLEGVGFKAGNVTADGAKPVPFEVAARIRPNGSLKTSGTFDAARNRAEGRIGISRIALLPLQPLLAPHVTLKLVSGNASVNGRFNWSSDRGANRLALRGGITIDDLLVNDAGGERFAASRQIVASGVNLDLRGEKLTIAEVRLVGPAGKLVINKDRSTNLTAIVRQPDKPAAAPVRPAAEKQKFNVVVDRVNVEHGTLDFADLSLVLPFATVIKELSGTITGLASDPATRAGVKLEGQVEDYGLARIDGTINPFNPRGHTDVAVIFRNVMMTPLSPYTATFAGRRIASGRLSLDLQYKLDNSILQGENKVVMEQFTLGERVESPTAVSLPLDLAVALLTDSDGKIDIAVPVRGNVDHPEFSYSHLVWQAIRTFITRIVTAPFRALASLFGGSGENLDEIAFDAGSARLLPPEREKLVRLTDTLKKRPQVKLLVHGRYHAERDAAALRDLGARRVVAERIRSKVPPGEDPGPVAYDNARTQRALEALLEERGGPDALAKLIAGFEKEKGREARRVNPALALVGRGSDDRDLYEAIFRRVAELQPLPSNALEELARARGAAIAKQVAEGGVGAARVGEQKPEPASGAQVTCKLSLDVAKATP
jgi:uncharacterized protein involved in outer membrane biogenesis